MAAFVDQANAKTLVRAVCRFTAFTSLSEKDIADLKTLSAGRRSLRRGEALCNQGDAPGGLYLLLEGWTASSLTFANGDRQLIKVHLPGDMLGMPSLAFRQCVDTVTALTPVEVGIVSRRALGHFFERNPRLGAVLFLISQEERAIMMDRIGSIGATNAAQALAALILQLHARVVRSEPETGTSFYMPLSQDDLADLIGITTVHLNRTLKVLRSRGLIEWGRHSISILDRKALFELAGLPKRALHHNAEWLSEML